MVIDCKVGPVTVSAAGADVIVPEVARMFATPPLMPVATPLELTLAAPGLSEPKIRVLAASGAVVASVYVPVAVKACVAPGAMLAVPGERAMEANAAPETVAAVELDTVPVAVFAPVTAAEIVAVPPATAVAKPVLLTIEIAAGLDEVQTAAAVTSPVVPFPYVPVALNCNCPPLGMDGLAGVIAMVRRLLTAPAPVMVTTCGLPTAPSEMVSVPGILPATAGVKMTVTVQVPLAATEVPQVLVCA